MARPIPWLKGVRVSNYRSIASANVSLGPLTVLVGTNGAGKSNFLDAVHFLAQAVATTPYQAADDRGGLVEILRRIPEQQDSLRIEVDVVVPWGAEPDQRAEGTYGFELARSGRRGQRPVEVVWEACSLSWQGRERGFTVDRGHVAHPGGPGHGSTIETDRLYLPAASALPNLAPLYGRLRNMAFYSLDLDTLRQPQPEADGALLGSRGEHLPDVLGQLASEQPAMKRRLDDYLAAIVPGLVSMDRQYAGTYVALESRFALPNEEVAFGGDALSEGTVRAAGVLAALFQPWVESGLVSLIGLEEPELALHPSAAAVLFDALTEASEKVQVLATSQSADLLDRDDVDPSTIRAVAATNGLTEINELDEVSLGILGDKRLTLGELMRSNQLSPRHVA